jgi:succinate dehydrogenase / fumarate reductase cytochrome b subunit
MSVQAQPTAAAARQKSSPTTTSIGLKAVMAVTGLVLFGFVIGHMLGNLQVYLPRGANGVWALDAYGEFLREIGHGGGIWIARAGLLAALVLHLGAAFALTRRSMAARPVAYRQWTPKQSTYASRTMRVSGPLIFLFVVYHLMHLTWGTVHHDFVPGAVHHNVTTGLAAPLATGVYVVAMIALGIHLYHGIWSLLQTLGLAHPRYEKLRRNAAGALAALVVVGNVSIPIAALAGWLPV